jgi:hypothetical protein
LHSVAKNTIAALLALAVTATMARADDIPLPTAQASAVHADFLANTPTPSSPGVTCVVDTGVNSNPDTDQAVIERQTVFSGDSSDSDIDVHHGTYLVMNIAAPANGWGMVGIAPQTRILSIRAIDNGAHSFLSNAYAAGIDRCLEAKLNQAVNVETVLMALGRADTDTTSAGQAVQNEIAIARAHGIAVVAAAGDDGGAVQWPARYDLAFAVGASDGSGGFCSSSSWGPELDIFALGCGDDTALWDTGEPATIDGSSTTAALVAGVLTALRAYKPDLSPEQAQQLLLSTADTSGRGNVMNVAAAFRAAGLGTMVDAYQPPALATPPRPAVIGVGTICPDGGVLSCQRPKLTAAVRKHSKIRLTVGALPSGSFLQAKVTRRWHTAAGASITLNAERWRKILLRFGSIDGERSRSLVVRHSDLGKQRHRPVS